MITYLLLADIQQADAGFTCSPVGSVVVDRDLADRGLRVPGTCAEPLVVRGEAGLLDPAERDAMVRMGRPLRWL